jgi:hypothetical protein
MVFRMSTSTKSWKTWRSYGSLLLIQQFLLLNICLTLRTCKRRNINVWCRRNWVQEKKNEIWWLHPSRSAKCMSNNMFPWSQNIQSCKFNPQELQQKWGNPLGNIFPEIVCFFKMKLEWIIPSNRDPKVKSSSFHHIYSVHQHLHPLSIETHEDLKITTLQHFLVPCCVLSLHT